MGDSGLAIAQGIAEGLYNATNQYTNTIIAISKLKQDKEAFDLDAKIKKLQIQKLEDPELQKFEKEKLQIGIKEKKAKTEFFLAKANKANTEARQGMGFYGDLLDGMPEILQGFEEQGLSAKASIPLGARGTLSVGTTKVEKGTQLEQQQEDVQDFLAGNKTRNDLNKKWSRKKTDEIIKSNSPKVSISDAFIATNHRLDFGTPNRLKGGVDKFINEFDSKGKKSPSFIEDEYDLDNFLAKKTTLLRKGMKEKAIRTIEEAFGLTPEEADARRKRIKTGRPGWVVGEKQLGSAESEVIELDLSTEENKNKRFQQLISNGLTEDDAMRRLADEVALQKKSKSTK